MLSKFFLDRPVFAWVIAIILMVSGVMAIFTLPIAQYPNVAPPTIAISANYTGGSAETVENSVTQIIEQKMIGFDNLLYQSATSESSGRARLELTFAPGVDPDMAWAQVQNKLQLAMAGLPSDVQNKGVSVVKSTRSYLMFVGITSNDGSMNGEDLRDYAKSVLESVLARVEGVGEVEVFGGEYAMRIWIDTEKLVGYGLTFSDVATALRSYNVEISAGQFGDGPAPEGQRLNASIIVQSFLKTPEEFDAIPIRTNDDGSVVRVSDIGHSELGTDNYNIDVRYNNQYQAGISIRLAAGANALTTADNVKKKMEELKPFLPPGMDVMYPYDTTPFIRVAIKEVVHTLVEAIILVFIVMFVFLGNFRSTIIPTIAVPVVLLGTFAILMIFGYSINMLTMFAMVLAIGLLVDDAIVVVENVERIMEEEGCSPREAASKSMDQITSALIGIGLVLSAVFGPMAFFSGSTGVIYRQFSVTIVSSMLLSVVVALVLTPVLCATMLKQKPKGSSAAESGIKILRPFFRIFEKCFNFCRNGYVRMLKHSLNRKVFYFFVYSIICVAFVYVFRGMPTSYLPDEDQGMVIMMINTPPGSTTEQTRKVVTEVADYFLENEADCVESSMTVVGFGLGGAGQNQGISFVKLKDWKERVGADKKVPAITKRVMARFFGSREANIYAFSPPPIMELGQAKGFDFQLIDLGGVGHEALTDARNQLMGMVMADIQSPNPTLAMVRPNGMDDVPQYHLDVDWGKAGSLGIPINEIHNTIATAFGSAYVNNFVLNGRVKRVYMQADPHYRMLPDDIGNLYVRNKAGKMVPVSALISGYWTYGSPSLQRFNGFPSMNILGEAAPGRSTGEAMKMMEDFVKKLPSGIGCDWQGLSYQERQATSQTGPLYAFSVLVIFLCLAALYESWPIPIAVLLTLPLGAIGGCIASSLMGMPNDVYFQIGLLTTLGLTTKNAILIVQFAKARVEEGMELIPATLEGAKLRFRPIMMTSLAFGFGVLPLTYTSGAGSGAQNAIGIPVLGGVISATFLVLIFAPLFYVIIMKLLAKKELQKSAQKRRELATGTQVTEAR